MLTIIVGDEGFDEEKQEFIVVDPVVLELEHSLVSLSKWESLFEKPFLVPGEKTDEEIIGYIKCMTLTPNIAPEVYHRFSKENVEAINNYIEAKMTATWFSDRPASSRHGEVITSELIYYWLTAYKIPFVVETWHLNRLFVLLRVCSTKNSKPRRMSPAEILARNHALNEKRKQELGTTG